MDDVNMDELEKLCTHCDGAGEVAIILPGGDTDYAGCARCGGDGVIEGEKSDDCCLLCNNWIVHKPKPGEKLFWYCKKDIVETVAYDDRPGIIRMTDKFRCVHYSRMKNNR